MMSDRRKALIFISFTCPVCASYSSQLVTWSKTMPPGWEAEFIPVVQPDKESVMAGSAFYAALRADPARLGDFLSNAFSAIQDRNMRMADGKTWAYIAERARIRGFGQAAAQITAEPLQRAYGKLDLYRIDATPSVAIAGQYVITPDSVNGDNNLFFQLANGLISRALG